MKVDSRTKSPPQLTQQMPPPQPDVALHFVKRERVTVRDAPLPEKDIAPPDGPHDVKVQKENVEDSEGDC